MIEGEIVAGSPGRLANRNRVSGHSVPHTSAFVLVDEGSGEGIGWVGMSSSMSIMLSSDYTT